MSIQDDQNKLMFFTFISICQRLNITEDSFDTPLFHTENVNVGSMGDEWVKAWSKNGWVDVVEDLDQVDYETRTPQKEYRLKLTNQGIAKYLMWSI